MLLISMLAFSRAMQGQFLLTEHDIPLQAKDFRYACLQVIAQTSLVASRWAANNMTLKNISVTALVPLITPFNITECRD